METALYLIPVTLGDTTIEKVLPSYNKEIILGIKHFIVEDVRSARRFLKKVERSINIDELTFYPLNKHTSPEDISGYLKPLQEGASMGVISEAGCPAVADPGADVVAIAQQKGGAFGGAFVYHPLGDGVGIQWAELRLSWVFAYRTG